MPATPKTTETQTPVSDVPPADWRHPEGFEDGFFEEWEDGDDDGDGYPDDEGW